MAAFGLLIRWSNAAGGSILAQLKELGQTGNSTVATPSAITTVGMFLGAFGGGIVGDKIGRKNASILYETIYVISMIVSALSSNMAFPIACCFVMEVGLDALLMTPLTGFTEYMPGRNRSTWSSQISFIGNWPYPPCSPTTMGLTPLIDAEQSWHMRLLIPAVLSLVATAIAWRNFSESPRWLESHGRYAETEKMMRVIEEGVVQHTGKPLPPVVFKDDGKAPRTVPYSALLADVLFKRVILDSSVLVAINVAQYTLVNWLSTIFMTQGINLGDPIVLNTMSMFGAPFRISIATLIMDKIPRKTVGVGLSVLTAVPGYIYSLQINVLLIMLIGLSLIAFVHMYAYYTSAVYVSEIQSTEAELRGSGPTSAVGRASGIVAPYAVTVLLNGYGVTGVFVLLGAISIIITIAIVTIGIETKGVSIESLGTDTVTSK